MVVTCACGDHAFAATTRGLNVLVSPEDAAQLDRKWTAYRDKNGYVTVTRTKTVAPNKRVRVVLAREIIEPKPGNQADHANGDSLDNRRPNLREATPSQNACNRVKPNPTGYKGVRPHGRRFVASIKTAGKRKHLGVFDTPEDASAAYRAAAHRFHGEFARFE